jgi:hypothetical protein
MAEVQAEEANFSGEDDGGRKGLTTSSNMEDGIEELDITRIEKIYR